ncbi:hypothetical protein C0992_004461 [Termitomyces sp. T32_za158]|nr:hypothetical protein C0992_004461 [Termitomyces sp. T32_za158]
MAKPQTFKQIVLNERPVGDFEPNTFRSEVLPLNLKPGEGEVLVRCTWLSLDPAMRGYVRDARSYLPPVKIGEVMRAQGLGVVVEAGPGTSISAGDTVSGAWGMTEYAIMKEKMVTKLIIPEGVQALDFLNTLGSSGLTAYFVSLAIHSRGPFLIQSQGLKDVAQVKAGDIMVVSGAAGSVGAIACQLGKRAGAKVYGLAGSPDKCDWLVKELGIDGALNYKSETFREDFKKIGYVDVFFDNVGGVHFVLVSHDSA